MSDRIIRKIDGYARRLRCAADKSVSIRAVILNGFASGKSIVENLSLCDDVTSAVGCMRELGASIKLNGSTAEIVGAAFRGRKLFCGNSATVARLLIGLTAGLNGVFEIDGDASLRSRPMQRAIDPLISMGAEIKCDNGRLPAIVIGSPLKGIEYEMPVCSAQVKSAVLLAGINAVGRTVIKERVKTRDHTENMLRAMGADIDCTDDGISVSESILRARDIKIVGDASAAAFPIALALCVRDGECVVENVGINPTRTAYLDVLRKCGAQIVYSDVCDEDEPYCNINVRGGKLRPMFIGSDETPKMIDEIPVLCALACFIDGTSVIEGAGELRVKESDRLSGTVEALRSLGADIYANGDAIIINGGKPLCYGTVDPRGDHRIAMTAAIAGAAGGGVNIIGAECVSVSYPQFFEEVFGV